MSERPLIGVVGDTLVDWMLVRGPAALGDEVELGRALNAGVEAHLSSRVAGVALAAEMAATILADADGRSGEVAVARPLPDAALVDPSCAVAARTFSEWALVPRVAGTGERVWRAVTYFGEQRAEPAPGDGGDAAALTARSLIVMDMGQGFRDAPLDLPGDAGRTPDQIVLVTSTQAGSGPLWESLAGRHGDRLTVLTGVDVLRMGELQVGHPLSWEQLAGEIVTAVRRSPLAAASRVIVLTGLSGAVLVARDATPTLVFDPRAQEGDWERARPGFMVGVHPAAAAIVACDGLGPAKSPAAATARMLGALRALYETGLESEGAGAALRYRVPGRVLVEALRETGAEFSSVELPETVTPAFTILTAALGGRDLLEAAEQAALVGPAGLPGGVPIERVGAWSSIDRSEIESVRSMRAVMTGYVEQYRRGEVQSRPLSIAVFGPPGAGKSFAVKQLAKALLPGGLKVLEFNLSQFRSDDELSGAFHAVRDAVLAQQLPLVFWDEFDTPLAGQKLGWLRHFLAPMQDGAFREAGTFHPTGPALFVFAGGTSPTLAGFAAGDDEADRLAKKPDFLSRLRGYVDVLGPNRRDEADAGFVVRRALLLRAILQQKAPQVFANDRMAIDDGVLRAFLRTARFTHGARSLEAMIDMSSLAGKLSYERGALPPRLQLALHVDPDEFLGLVDD